MSVAINPQELVSVVRPLLESYDPHRLIQAIRLHWNSDQIPLLLNSPDAEARKVALLCLSLIGDRTCIDAVQLQLRDQDATVNQMAEHALWSIWFRLGSADANQLLNRGAQCSRQKNFSCAIDCFDRAIAMDRDFSELYHQRAISRFMQDDFEPAIADCRKAVRLMPCHFSAWATMGHAFSHLSQLDHAQRAYERALEINPHMTCVRDALAELQRDLKA